MSDEKEDPRMDMGRNSEHYSDPTPGTAWENMRREEKRLDAARLTVVRPWCRFCARRQSLRALRLSDAYRCATKRAGRSTDKWKTMIYSA